MRNLLLATTLCLSFLALSHSRAHAQAAKNLPDANKLGKGITIVQRTMAKNVESLLGEPTDRPIWQDEETDYWHSKQSLPDVLYDYLESFEYHDAPFYQYVGVYYEGTSKADAKVVFNTLKASFMAFMISAKAELVQDLAETDVRVTTYVLTLDKGKPYDVSLVYASHVTDDDDDHRIQVFIRLSSAE